MKKFSKKFFALFLCFAMIVGMVPAAFAAADSEEVSVEVITDKDSYKVGDKVDVTVKVTNNTTKKITDVKVDVTLPKGLTFAEGSSSKIEIASIEAGASTDANVKAVIEKIPYTGDMTTVIPFVLLAVAAVAMILLAKSKKIKKLANVSAALFIIAVAGLAVPAVVQAATGEATGKKQIDVDGVKADIIAKVTYTTGDDATDPEEPTDPENPDEGKVGHVTVHDPSIVKDPKTGMYYVFGSHRAWAKSEDLINWTTFTNNINTDYKNLFAEASKWSALGGNQGNAAGYDVSGNCWAPDVIWNEEMGKWCMYMSINGDSWYTSVVLLTADDIEGDWTTVGSVVYSGFTSKEEAELTDFYDVYKGTDFPDRYNENRNGNHTYGMNAIDPCVFYDEDGRMWMVYGSWFGGLYMIELDPNTGMRLASHTYETVANASDEYQGIKLAGGSHVSGEAPYIEYVDGYYYLYVTLGGLAANGGYNMRVFRSENVEGPYVDLSGDDARYTAGTNNINGKIGVRVMSNYKWDYMDYGYVAQGHNSAFVDEDGKAYVVYHTRFDNQGEGHQVRVHQQFVNEDGWLVTAPFEYYNETLKEVNTSDVVGAYSILVHKLNVDYANKECVQTINVELKEDGTIAGDKTGTWEFGTDGAPYVTMVIDGVTYKGVFVQQKMEESTTYTMTFTVLGTDEVNIWGYRLAGNDEDLAQEAADALTMPIGAMSDMTLPATGLNATSITWKSSNTDVITDAGKVTRPSVDTIVKMTATVSYGSANIEKTFDVKVFADYDTTKDKVIWTYADEAVDLSNAVKGTYQYSNPFNTANVTGINIDNGVSIKFHVKATGNRGWTNDILSFNTNAVGGLYVMDMAYLGYNGTGGYMDANLQNGKYTTPWVPGTNYIGDEADVEIKITPVGFEYYVNGELAYTQDDIQVYTGADGSLAVDANDKTPGTRDLKAFTNVLTYLNKTATVMNFGWGSWWDGGFKGTISDVELSVLGTPEIDFKGNLFLEEFVTTTPILTQWTCWEAPTEKLTAEYSADHGYYLQWLVTNGSGNRGAYYNFATEYQLDKNYVFEADVMLNSSPTRDTVLTIFNSDVNKPSNINAVPTSNYLLQMTVKTNSTNATITGSDEAFSIAKNTWTHIKFVVNDEGKVLATIGDKSVVVDANGSSKLGGIFAVAGRGNGMFCIDNIKLNNATADDLAGFDEFEQELPTVTASSTGIAYLDTTNEVTVKFSSDTDLSAYGIKINGTAVAVNDVVGMAKVKAITYGATDCTVTLEIAPISGWHAIVGSYDVAMVSNGDILATQNVSYDLSVSAATDYKAIAGVAANEYTSAYYKVVGTKLYVMTIIKTDKIHCDGVLGFGWHNGIASELKATIAGKEYSVGSHVFNATWANPITWNADKTMIDSANVVRGYMALGTFDSDADTDKGAVLLNVLDLTDIGLDAATIPSTTVKFAGFIGPNDGGVRFVEIDATKTYTLD